MRSRVFVVGCPRSGTTLVQAMLGAHPDVFTFSESHYFLKVWGRLWSRRRAGIVSPRAARAALALLEESVGESGRRPPPRSLLFTTYGRRFVETVDAASARQGSDVWVEKSPIHLQCVREIDAVVPTPKFVHVVRDGSSVVDSFFRVCLRDPDWTRQVLKGKVRPRPDVDEDRRRVLRAIAERWNHDVALSKQLEALGSHRIVRYDRLLDDPTAALASVCDFVGIPFDAAMLRHWEVADQVLGYRRDRPYMQAVFVPVRSVEEASEPVLGVDDAAFVRGCLTGGGQLDALGFHSPSSAS